jgi:phage terminase large subunit-like protein
VVPKAGKIRDGGHLILRWHTSNAVARKDSAGNVKLDKEKARKKIDGMAALVNAIAGAICYPPEPPCVYEKRGVLVL